MTRLALAAALLASACAADGGPAGGDHDLALPAHFPAPPIPAGNPLTADKVELGRHLFYDQRLSAAGTVSCSSCHQQRFAFADDRALSEGATGERGALNAPSLANAVYLRPLTWAHPDLEAIEDQLVRPMFGTAPVEMGMAGAEPAIAGRLGADPTYRALFVAAFPGEPIDLDRARLALASFVRALISGGAPFDAYLLGDPDAISANARRGSELFFSARLGCGGCHAGFTFTTAAWSAGSAGPQQSPYHNIGLYDVDGAGGYPDRAPGLIAETGVPRDMGRFRVPTLRNVALTAPYAHDGSVATLAEMIAIYEAGGRNLEDGPFAGDGRANPWRSALLPAFTLSEGERADLLAFLDSLTDGDFVADPRWSDPW